MSRSSEQLLRLLQHFIKHPKQIKQIHGRLVTESHLIHSPPPKNTLFYNTLIRAYYSTQQCHISLLLFTHMLRDHARPNSFTFPSLLKAAAAATTTGCCFFTGQSVHNQAVKRGVVICLRYARYVFDEIAEPCVVCCNAMINAFVKNGDMGSAISLFDEIGCRDVVSWTSIVNGFGANGMFYKAIMFFEKMVVHDDVISGVVKPNEATFVSVLSSCANLDGGGAFQQGRQIHAYIVRNEIQLTIFMATALIALYGKLGCLRNASNVFKEMRDRAVCVWNVMISSLASNGREKHALDMFENMKIDGMRPNSVTFVTVLTACARAKLVDLGLRLFESMSRDYGVVPKMEHYGCVVDLLARAGLLHEATEFMRNMPFEPDATVLGALFGSCRVYGAVELADEIGKRLIEMQPWHCGRYVMLSGIHFDAKRWSRAADLRREMIDAGIKKIPALSCTKRGRSGCGGGSGDVEASTLERISCSGRL